MIAVAPLDIANEQRALRFLRASPYRNAIPLANATQLRRDCDVVVAELGGRVVGVGTTYHDLPVPNINFAADRAPVVAALLHGLMERNHHLHSTPLWALVTEQRRTLLQQCATVTGWETEFQMGVEPETLKPAPDRPTRRLTSADLPAMRELAELAGLTVWHDSTLDAGPAFGCDIDGQLVAMAATHFATTDIIEIGHIATHPAARRRGYASAVTAALTQAAFALAPRVFLMVLERNTTAYAAYRKLGFFPLERFSLTEVVCGSAPTRSPQP